MLRATCKIYFALHARLSEYTDLGAAVPSTRSRYILKDGPTHLVLKTGLCVCTGSKNLISVVGLLGTSSLSLRCRCVTDVVREACIRVILDGGGRGSDAKRIVTRRIVSETRDDMCLVRESWQGRISLDIRWRMRGLGVRLPAAHLFDRDHTPFRPCSPSPSPSPSPSFAPSSSPPTARFPGSRSVQARNTPRGLLMTITLPCTASLVSHYPQTQHLRLHALTGT